MRTKIFVMTHKKFDPPRDSVYIPLHVGRALGQELGYTGDDTGDSISALNPYYGELTGFYWLWKNESSLAGEDIIGTCHYRRYFVTEDRRLMRTENFENMLSRSDVMLSDAKYAPGSYRDYYGEAHNARDLQMMGDVIRELYPEDYGAFCSVMDNSRYYYGNLCVTRKKIFDAYCEWLFPIFFELSARIDVSGYDLYHKRLFGFLSENLMQVYCLARGFGISEGHICLTDEKAETAEFKLAMGELVRQGRFGEARELFYGYLKLRPDIRLEMSDIRKEIPDIEIILYILEQEQKGGEESFYRLSHRLEELILHLRKLRDILKKEALGKELSEEERNYLSETKVSETAREIIRINL